MLRLILFLLMIYILFRLALRLLAKPAQLFKSGLFSKGDPTASHKTGGGPRRVIDEMRSCAHCGTYHPSRYSYQKKGLYFCNPQCHEAYQQGKKA